MFKPPKKNDFGFGTVSISIPFFKCMLLSFFQGVPGNPGEPGLKGDKVIWIFSYWPVFMQHVMEIPPFAFLCSVPLLQHTLYSTLEWPFPLQTLSFIVAKIRLRLTATAVINASHCAVVIMHGLHRFFGGFVFRELICWTLADLITAESLTADRWKSFQEASSDSYHGFSCQSDW